MGIWVVVVVLGVGVGAAAVLSMRRANDVEPTVREFAEFRDAIGRQVGATTADTGVTRRHLDRITDRSAADRSGSGNHPG
jgi:hypothetical protein